MTLAASIGAAAAGAAESDWTTYGHDPQRTGNAAGESVIDTVSVTDLALAWAAPVDGKVTAQPLFVGGVQVGGQTRDVVVAATANNSVYALDASTGAQLWRTHFGAPSGQGDVPGGFGISGAPVIDPVGGRVYAVTDDGYLQTLALADGGLIVPALQVITDHPDTNSVWGGLNLVGGSLYIATASNGPDPQPWWGRVVRVDVSGATPVVANTFKVVPSIPEPDGGGGIWGYGGVSVDSAGRVFAAAAADNNETYTPYSGRMLALGSALALLGSYDPPHPSPCVGDPGACDMDFGATPIVFQPPGCPTLVAAVSKDGNLYKLAADDLAASATTSLQILALNIPFDGPGRGGLTGVPAYWPGGNMLFVTDGRDPSLGSFGVAAGVVGLSVGAAPSCDLQVAWSVDWWALGLTGDEQPPSSPTVAGGVVFVGAGTDGSVHAYDAATGSELWNSGADIAGATFAAPTVAKGALYVGSWDGFGASNGGTVRAFAPGASPPPPPPGFLLGNAAVEPRIDTNPVGVAEAFETTASASGTIGAVSVYIDVSSTLAPTATLVVGLYADSGGHPGALIAQASSSAPLQAGAWNAIPMAGASVTAGTPYWIAILMPQGSSDVMNFRDGSGGCSSETSVETDLGALPASWTTGGSYSTCPVSAYASAVALPPSPVPLPPWAIVAALLALLAGGLYGVGRAAGVQVSR